MTSWIDEALLCEPVLVDGNVLQQIMPGCEEPDTWADLLATYMPRYGVESAHSTALFLAQIGHESIDLNTLEENFNYSVGALLPVFGTNQITSEAAEALGRSVDHPADREGIANDVYGDEWGETHLGNTEEGDGWRYRGRGLIQLTGRANYTRCAQETGLDLVNDPDLLAEDREAAVIAALWFWDTYVSGNSVKTTTRQINGGYTGLDDRVDRYRRALAVLEV